MPFRVLSLDGGGAWALIEVRTLIALFRKNATGHQVLQNFDLVAANSGGSLVLAGLVEDLSLQEILQYFMDENNRRSIFSQTTMIGDDVLRAILGIGPKYSAIAKLPAIERLLPNTGDEPLAGCMKKVAGPNGSPVHLLIVGFDYDRNARKARCMARVFASVVALNSRWHWDARCSDFARSQLSCRNERNERTFLPIGRKQQFMQEVT